MRELTRTRRLVRRFEPGSRSLILLYHRIDRPVTDPWRLAVSPERFGEHCAVLRQRFRPLPLADLVAALRAGRPPARGVAVTFDDGYADNLLRGVPLLHEYTIPATIYITADYLGAPHEFWWKQIEQLLLEPGELPRRLQIDHPLLNWSWDLGPEAVYPAEHALALRDWVISEQAGEAPTRRHAAFLSLLHAMERIDSGPREEILADLFAAAGVLRASRTSHRMLTVEQAQGLHVSDGIEVGAHTLNHPRLSMISPTQQEIEIRHAKTRLQDLLDANVETFAYPFGQATDLGATTVRLVHAAGYSSAVAVRDLAVSRSSGLFELPRVGVADWDGDEFERRLEWWLRRGL